MEPHGTNSPIPQEPAHRSAELTHNSWEASIISNPPFRQFSSEVLQIDFTVPTHKFVFFKIIGGSEDSLIFQLQTIPELKIHH